MIIRSITVSSWRCFLGQLSIGPFDDRLNIVFAPNGTGKTTIFEALRRAFLDAHKSSGRDVDASRPWGRQLSPQVIVEFDSEGIEYRLSKSFLDMPKSILERKEEGNFRSFKERQGADEFARELLVKEAQSKKSSKHESWGLAQVLWAPQGQLELAPLSGVLVQDIRSALSQQAMGVGAYEKKINERYKRYFTPKNKELKTGSEAPEIVKIRDELKDKKKHFEEWHRSYAELDDLVESVANLREKSTRLSAELTSHEKAFKDQQEKVRNYEKLLEKKYRLESQGERWMAEYQSVSDKIDTIARTEKQVQSAKDEVERIHKELPGRIDKSEKLSKLSLQLSESLQKAKERKKEVEAQRIRAKSASDLQQAEKDRLRIEKTLTEVEQLDRSLKELNAERATITAPDSDTLVAIRECINDQRHAHVLIDASLISLEIIPEFAGRLDVLSGENMGPVALEPGTPHVVRGTPEVVAILPGVARLRASGPSVSMEETRESLEKAVAKLADLTKPFGTTDTDELEALYKRAESLNTGIRDTNVSLKAVLGENTLENLQEHRVALLNTISLILTENPDWVQFQPDPAILQNEVDELGSVVDKDFLTLGERSHEADKQALMARNEVDNLRTDLNRNSQRITDLGKTLDEIKADGKSLNERHQERIDIAMRRDAVDGNLKETNELLEQLGQNPGELLEELQRKLRDLESQERDAFEEAAKQDGNLEACMQRAPYSRLAEIEEQIQSLEIREKEEAIHTEAVKLLKVVVEQTRSDILAEVTFPVEKRASEIFMAISDERLGEVKLDEGFQPVGVVPRISNEEVGLKNNVSGGEYEQIQLATRLALAETLRKKDRQALILDDILTATDSVRIEKIMRVFEEVSNYLQLIILTCHPERYRSLQKAKNFDLQSLLG